MRLVRVAITISSVQFSRSVVSNSLRPHDSQHARPPCPSPTPGVHSDSTSIESVMPSSHLILCRPLLLLPPITPSIRVFSNESTLRVITIKRQKWRGENFPSCPRCQFSGLQLSFSAMKSIFFKNLSSFSGWDDLGYETTHLSKTPDLFFLLWGASQWVLIMFLGLQKYERLPTWTDCKQCFFFNASLSGCHERIIPEPSRCILLSVTSPAVITGFLFFFFYLY